MVAAQLAQIGATEVDGRGGVFRSESGRAALTHDVLSGLCFAHVLEAAELVEGRLHAWPDLSALSMFREDWPTAAGPPARFSPDRRSLDGPAGWLDGFRAGDTVEFRLDGGTLSWHRQESSHGVSPAVLAVMERVGDDGIEVDQLVATMLVELDGAFVGGAATLAQHLAQARLELDGDRVVPATAAGEGGTMPAADVQVATPGDDALLVIARADGGQAPDPDACIRIFDDLDVCAELADRALGAPNPPLTGLRAALDAAGEPLSSGGLFLRARLAEQEGDTAAAEALTKRVLAASPDFVPALIDSAGYASDRGEASRAATLLVKAGVEAGDPELSLLRDFTRPGPLAAARNELCPCGSGRRYKRCHLASNGYRPVDRVAWIGQKLITFSQRPARREALWTLASAHAGVSATAPGTDAMALLLSASDPAVLAVHALRPESARSFLRERGALLPDDEASIVDHLASGKSLRVERGPEGASLSWQVRIDDEFASIGPIVPIHLEAAEALEAASASDADADWLAAAAALGALDPA